jgi:hypothetical protein
MRFIHRYILPLILAIVVISASNLHFGKQFYRGIILSDGKGYYAYLPAVFIYHDLHFQFFDAIEVKYYDKNTWYDYRAEMGNICFDRYFAGTAVAMAPFFFIGHGLSYLFGKPMDGYSYYYAVMVNLAAIFYLFLFLLYLRKLLRLYGVSPPHQSLVLVSFAFGTNLFYYTNVEPSMSHVYSAAFITAFLYHARKYFLEPDQRRLLYGAGLLGMILLIRPQNVVVCLALPFMAGGLWPLAGGFLTALKRIKALLAGIAIIMAICSIQLILYKLETGHFWVYPYPGERFFWLEPEIGNILFSYYRGFFVYTPLAFISLGGLYYLWKQDRFRFWSFLLFFGILTYILSSWWSWSYGGCFGLRAYVEFYGLFALLAALVLEHSKPAFRNVYMVLMFLCIVVCQVQTFQYRHNYTYWNDMSAKRYWRVFMKIEG